MNEGHLEHDEVLPKNTLLAKGPPFQASRQTWTPKLETLKNGQVDWSLHNR
jgi:hypothetical protein